MSFSPVRKLAKCSLLKPIVVVLGATGVGKSKLAIELACKFSGEVVNADAMQVYKGLDIVTNKVSKEEQNQCPHHLLDCISPLRNSYSIADYKTSALEILDDIHSRGKLPVIVGGTNYYIESLLWDFVLEINNKDSSSAKSSDIDDGIDLNASGKELHVKLMEVDPERGKKIHPADVRKVRRALEVYKQTGRTMSSLLNDQHINNNNNNNSNNINGDDNDYKKETRSGPLRYPNSCMLWVTCDKPVLHERINKRVHSMLDAGLLEELLKFHENYNHLKTSENKERDYEHGIFQSIGFKEFHKYLIMSQEERQTYAGKGLFLEGVENMKVATRQYSKRQTMWIKNRFLRKRGDTPLLPIYSVDSSNVDRWNDAVRDPAFDIVESHLKGEKIRHDPLPVQEHGNISVHNVCTHCDKVFVDLYNYESHMKSRRHKETVAKIKKLEKLKEESQQNDEALVQ